MVWPSVPPPADVSEDGLGSVSDDGVSVDVDMFHDDLLLAAGAEFGEGFDVGRHGAGGYPPPNQRPAKAGRWFGPVSAC